MNRLAKLFSELPHDDLLLIKKDLDSGNIARLLEKKINKAKAKRIVLCPICSTPIREGEGLHLRFGPPDFRKKATFDGTDCMQYFLENHMKKK